MDYKKLHEETLAALQKMVFDGKITEETARNICSDFIKESEDEKIRKSIIGHLKECRNNTRSEVMIGEYAKWISWLEKQGGQKPEIKYIYPKFRVGDVIEPAKPNGSFIPVRVRYIGDGSYYCEADDRKAFSSIPICNENEYVLTEQKPVWSKENSCYYDDICEILINLINSQTSNVNKDAVQKDLDWLMSVKESQLKSSWSEEDEEMLNDSIKYLELFDAQGIHGDRAVPCINWLKSLKPQPHWKPSEEQMEVFFKATPVNLMPDELSAYHSLYNDLQKL